MKISRQIFLLLTVFLHAISAFADNPGSDQSSEKIELDSGKTSSVQAYSISSLVSEHLETLAIEFAEKGYRSEYTIGNIDPYHKLKSCSEQPTLSINRSPLIQNRVTTEIKCADAKPWRLFVSSEFNLFKQAVIASTNIRRGQVISADNLSLKETIINKSHYSLYNDLGDVVGMIAKRSIRAESSIQPGHLSPPKLIKRGDNVVIVASNDAISVRMNGTALADGALGQQIPVRNIQSKRVVKARVSEAGLVSIVL